MNDEFPDPFRDGPWAVPDRENALLQRAPCPYCGSRNATPVTYVFRLSIVRSFATPWLWNLHDCRECGARYSVPGPRLKRFFILVLCPALALAMLLGLAFWFGDRQ